MNQNKTKALITGASSGIGEVYADRLAKRGHDLILVARNVERLNALAKRLTLKGAKVEVVEADLTRKADLIRVENILRTDKRIEILVNNAGSAIAKPLADSGLDELENMISLNVTALTRLSAVVAPEFVKRGHGTVINISSVAALGPDLVGGAYAGSKAYVLHLSQSMQGELGTKGVRVQAVLPGATRTELWSHAGVDINQLPKEWIMSTDDLVDAALSGLDQGELVTIPAMPDQKPFAELMAARDALKPVLSATKPAARYLT